MHLKIIQSIRSGCHDVYVYQVWLNKYNYNIMFVCNKSNNNVWGISLVFILDYL